MSRVIGIDLGTTIPAKATQVFSTADEDRRFHELVKARNRADALIHSTRTTVADFADRLDAAAKERIESLIAELEEAMTGRGDERKRHQGHRRQDRDLGDGDGQALRDRAQHLCDR